jgi:hypothetical protein
MQQEREKKNNKKDKAFCLAHWAFCFNLDQADELYSLYSCGQNMHKMISVYIFLS